MKHFTSVRIESPAFEPDSVRVAELTGHEAISRLFEFELRLATLEAGIDEEKLLTNPVVLIFERPEETGGPLTEVRRIAGMIRTLVDRGLSESQHREYRATLVPRAWQASLSSTSDVCMNMSIPEIVEKKLQEGAGLKAGTDVELRLKRTYTPREFIVQYKETNLDFVARLTEDIGIHFFFETVDGRDVMVFADENAAFKPANPKSSVYSARGETVQVHELEAKRQLVTVAFAARDYNYRNPSMEVSGQAQIKALGVGKYDEYGPHAKTPEEATLYATVRAQEAAARSLTFEGKSDLAGLRAGSHLMVEGHPRGNLDLVVTAVRHDLTQPVFGHPTGRERPYTNTLHALPKAVEYRPPRLTPKPVVNSVVTGIVQHDAATDFGAIDEQGRYRVTFLYDSVTGRGDGKASRPLRMAQPSVAANRGFHLPLKPGTEVIISCVNGDPDRPIIAGAVPNPQTPSPITSASSHMSVWNTNKNSIAIDDQSARCKVSVAGETHVIQVGEPDGPELGILLGTVNNISESADGAKTETNEEKSVYTEQLTVLAEKLILQAAGIPNPLSLWEKKFKDVKDKVEEYAKKTGEFAEQFMGDYRQQEKEAKDAQKEAQKELKQTVEDVKKKLKVEEKAKPQAILDPATGQTRHETKEEAEQRTFQEELKKDPAAQDELHAQVDKTLAKQDALDDFQQPEKDLKATAAGVEKKWEDDVNAVQKVGEDLAKGKWADTAKKYAKKIPGKAGEIADAAIKVLDESGKLKEIEAALKKSGVGKKLLSVLGKTFSKAANNTLDATVAASQKLSMAVPKGSGERHAASVGTFSKPFNIQLSRDSAALYAAKDAFVFGRANATMFSIANTCVLGAARVDVKSKSLVEVAAKKVVLTGSEIVDVHGSKKIKLVAHDGDKDVALPDNFNMYFHAKEGIKLDAVEKDISVQAKKNIKLKAEEENIELSAKKRFKLTCEEEDIDVRAKKKVEVYSLEDGIRLDAKKKITMVSKDDAFTLECKTKGIVKGTDNLKLEGKESVWNASSKLELKGGSNSVKISSSKIELG